MAGTTTSLRRKIGSAGDLQAVVRAMKAQAAASVGQYERSVAALADYARTVELGLTACFREDRPADAEPRRHGPATGGEVCVVVFGSDQGLVGRFNDVVIDFALEALGALPGEPQVWAVGDRVRARMADAGVALLGQFAVPSSVQAITPLVGEILVATEARERPGKSAELHLFHNCPMSGSAYAPISQRLLPLDGAWRRGLAERPWPTSMLPQVMGAGSVTVRALIREYLFVSLFRACAESLASENASRLAAMDRADRNIDKLLEKLRGSFHRLRQSGIDEELSDVTAGFNALSPARELTASPRRAR
jgi:F-type H+-transporting ATPase subunit gamma